MSGSDEKQTSERERVLLEAAEDVLVRWAIVRVSEGELGGCGLAQALRKLDLACDAYEAEECAGKSRNET